MDDRAREQVSEIPTCLSARLQRQSDKIRNVSTTTVGLVIIYKSLPSIVKCCYNAVRYYINNYRTWAKISIRYWIHKRHPIHRPNGWAMGCLLWENWPRYNGTTLYQVIQVKLVSSSVITVQLFRVLWARCQGANHTMVLDDLVNLGFKEPLTKPVVTILDINR